MERTIDFPDAPGFSKGIPIKKIGLKIMGLGLLGGLVGLLMLWVVVNFAGGLIPEFLLAPVRDPALLDKAEAKQ